MLFVRFQGNPFNITVIQVNAQASNAEEVEVEQFYEDLQDLLELTLKKDVLFIIGDWNAKFTYTEYVNITKGIKLYCYQPISLHPRAHMLSHVWPGSSVHGLFQARILQ